MDFLFVPVLLVLVALTWGLVALCDRLRSRA